MPQRNVNSAFWTDPKVKEFSGDARYLLLFLITSYHGHLTGLYNMPMGSMSEHTRMAEERVVEALRVLTSGSRPPVWYDAATNEVWVVNMFAHQPGFNSGDVKKGAAKHLGDIHSEALRDAFDARYLSRTVSARVDYPMPDVLLGSRAIPFTAATERNALGTRDLSRPSQGTVPGDPPGTGTGSGTDTGKSSQSCTPTKLPPSPESDDSGGVKSASQFKDERPKRREVVAPQTERRTSPRCAPPLAVQAFERDFWPAYPRKVGKRDARKEWLRLRVNGGAKVVMDALSRELGEWKHRDPGMIPYPAKWLRTCRWEDLADEARRADEARARAKQAVQAARERFAMQEGSEDPRGTEQVAQQATANPEDAAAPQEPLPPKPPKRRVYSREEVDERVADMTRADADAFEEHLRKAGLLANEGGQKP